MTTFSRVTKHKGEYHVRDSQIHDWSLVLLEVLQTSRPQDHWNLLSANDDSKLSIPLPGMSTPEDTEDSPSPPTLFTWFQLGSGCCFLPLPSGLSLTSRQLNPTFLPATPDQR